MRNSGRLRLAMLVALIAVAAVGLVNLRSHREAISAPAFGGERNRSTELDPPMTDSAPARLVASAAVDSASGHELVVFVRDDAHRAVAGTELHLVSPSASRLVGTTNDQGECIVNHEAIETASTRGNCQTVAIHPGFVSAAADISTSKQGRLEIVMHAGRRISGLVLDPTGSPAREGVLVVAGPSELLTARRLSSLLEGATQPGWFVVATDSQGRFVINDVAPSRHYSVWAGGGDGLAAEPTRCSSTQPDVTIRLSYAWGARLDLVDSALNPIASTGDYLVFGRENTSLLVDKKEARVVSPFYALLCGIPQDFALQSATRRLIVATSATNVTPALHLRLAPPGYLPAEYDCLMRPISQLASLTQCRLVSVAEGYGTVLLEITGLRSDRAQTGDGEFVLKLLDSDGAMLDLAFEARAGEVALSGIPYGSFEARIVARMGSFAFPEDTHDALSLVIGPNPAKLRLDLSRHGELHVEIRDVEGQAYTGPAVLSLVHGQQSATGARFEGNGSWVAFDLPPYVVRGLVPGQYSVVVSQPRGASFGNGTPVSLFSILPGDDVTLQSQLK